MTKRIASLVCLLLLVLALEGGCIVSSPQYHLDMYCGRTECKAFPFARYWFFSWGTWENFRENLVNVPFMVPLFLPVGISLDLLTDVVLCPIDLPLSFFLGEEDGCMVGKSAVDGGYQITVPARKPAVAYSFAFGGDCHLLLLQVRSGEIQVSGIKDNPKDTSEQTWTFTETTFTQGSCQTPNMTYPPGSAILLVLGRDFLPIYNPFPWMSLTPGYKLYMSSLGVFSTKEAFCTEIEETISRSQADGPSYSQSRLRAFLDFHNGLSEMWNFLDIPQGAKASEVNIRFYTSQDFQGDLIDLGTVEAWLRRAESEPAPSAALP